MKNETKIKIQSHISTGSELRYRQDDSLWGLLAYYQTYTLFFPLSTKSSGSRFFKIKSFFNKRIESKKNKIIPKLNLFELLSESAQKAILNSYVICKKRGGKELSVEDIFLSLLCTPSVSKLLKRLRVDPKEARKLINNYSKLSAPLCGDMVKKIPFEAFALSLKLHNHKIGSLMLLGALLKSTPHENILQAIFSNIGLTAAKLELFSVWLLDLNHDFPKNSTSDKLLYALRQAEDLETHFSYFFDFTAIEAAVEISEKSGDIKKTLPILVKTLNLAKQKQIKFISAELVKAAN